MITSPMKVSNIWLRTIVATRILRDDQILIVTQLVLGDADITLR